MSCQSIGNRLALGAFPRTERQRRTRNYIGPHLAEVVGMNTSFSVGRSGTVFALFVSALCACAGPTSVEDEGSDSSMMAAQRGKADESEAARDETGEKDCGTFTLSATEVAERRARLDRLESIYGLVRPGADLGVCRMTLAAAHRGDTTRGPQNTLPAIEAAVEEGAVFVEIDVVLNANDDPIVLHDRTYVRPGLLPAGFDQIAGPTSACWGRNFEVDPWELMKTCDVSRGDSAHAGATAPLLEDVLGDFGHRTTTFLIELKKSRDPKTLAVRASELLELYVPDPARRWVISFEDDALSAAKPGIRRGRLLSIGRDVMAAVDRAHDLGYELLLTDLSGWQAQTLAHATEKGIALGAYTLTPTVPEYHERAQRLGGTVFVTDRVREF